MLAFGKILEMPPLKRSRAFCERNSVNEKKECLLSRSRFFFSKKLQIAFFSVYPVEYHFFFSLFFDVFFVFFLVG